MNPVPETLRRATAIFIFGLASVVSIPAHGEPGTSQTDRTAIESIVRDYILNNPEIVMEAIERLQEKKRRAEADADRQLVAAYAKQIFEDETAPVGGNPDGDVTLVEFFDYRCGVCRRVHPIVEELIKTDSGIRRVYKEWPILGPDSVIAARAALASRTQEKYFVFHKAMMEARGQLDRAAVMRIAAAVGIDTDRLARDMESDEIGAAISRNYALAEKLRLNGTPSFLIGDRIVRGGRNLETMRELVGDARAAPK